MKNTSSKVLKNGELLLQFVIVIFTAFVVIICTIGCFSYVVETDRKSFKTTIEDVVVANEKEIVAIFTNEILKDSTLILKYDDVSITENKIDEKKSFIAELKGNTIKYNIINQKVEKYDESKISSSFVLMIITIIGSTSIFVIFFIFVIRGLEKLLKKQI